MWRNVAPLIAGASSIDYTNQATRLPARGNHATINLDHARLRRNLPELRNQLLRASRTLSWTKFVLKYWGPLQGAAFLSGIVPAKTFLLCDVAHRTSSLELSLNLLLLLTRMAGF